MAEVSGAEARARRIPAYALLRAAVAYPRRSTQPTSGPTASATTYALGILAAAPGHNIPVVTLPFVNSALADRAPFEDSVNALRSEGVRILLGPAGFEPRPPGSGGDRISDFPWQLAIASVSDQLPRLSCDPNEG